MAWLIRHEGCDVEAAVRPSEQLTAATVEAWNRTHAGSEPDVGSRRVAYQRVNNISKDLRHGLIKLHMWMALTKKEYDFRAKERSGLMCTKRRSIPKRIAYSLPEAR